MKKYFLFLVVPLFLLFVSCSGLLSTSRAGSITVRFNPSKLITSSNRAITALDIPWSKAVFTIIQEKEKIVTTIENKGSSELTFTHTAPIGTTVQITIAIYQTIDGIEVVAYRGASQSITLTAGTNNVVIRVQKIYKVGDTGPAGGIIFYVNPTAATDGWTYLEAAPVDLEGTFAWDRDLTHTRVSTSMDIGTGAANTREIIAILGDIGAAATAADAYEFGGKNDWFLPSIKELNLMYENLKDKNLGNFEDALYRSSSQYIIDYAWCQNFSDGSNNGGFNDGGYLSVRPIRAF